MVGVAQQSDKVVLILTGRRKDVMLTCAQAEAVVHHLREKAAAASIAPPSLVKGEPWECQVQSYDGFVAIRFTPPWPGAVTRIPLPFGMARQLADRIEFCGQQAAYKMRFVFKRN